MAFFKSICLLEFMIVNLIVNILVAQTKQQTEQ